MCLFLHSFPFPVRGVYGVTFYRTLVCCVQGDDSADSAKTCNSGKEKATATTAQTFSFSLLSAASEDEIDQCGGMRYQKREGVFRKVWF